MPERRRFTQTEPLEKQLTAEAARLRKEARGTPPGHRARSPCSQSPPSRDNFSHARVAGLRRATSAKISSIRMAIYPTKKLHLGAESD
jgi:hypothetical protein